MAKGTCSIDGCESSVTARGWCRSHYRRWKRHGDPLLGKPGHKLSVDERFESKVDRGQGSCWLWTGALNNDGYGSFWSGATRTTGGPVMVLAHRWAYERFVGPIPEGLNVCHTCDTPRCVNPAHFFLGDQAANVEDCIAKGRRGTPITFHKLSAKQHAEIRDRYTGAHGEQSALAREYGVAQATISTIVGGRARARCEVDPP